MSRVLLCLVLVACAQARQGITPGDDDTGGDANGSADAPIANGHTLTVMLGGNGSGSVTSAPIGITCGTDCDQLFADGTAVQLTATPAAGSQFAGWTGGGCSGTGACTVQMTGDAQVTAMFTTGCDAFAGADTTTLPGWTEQVGDWTRTGEKLQQAATGGVYTHHVTRDGSTQTDGCAKVVANLGVGPANIQAVGLVLRWTSSTSYVVALIQNNSGSTFNMTYIYQYPGETQLAAGTTQNYGTAALVKACITGSTVTLTIDANMDGTPESTTTGTTTLAGAGLAGVMTHSFGNPATADDFCWGANP